MVPIQLTVIDEASTSGGVGWHGYDYHHNSDAITWELNNYSYNYNILKLLLTPP